MSVVSEAVTEIKTSAVEPQETHQTLPENNAEEEEKQAQLHQSIFEVLRKYLKEELTPEEARMQTPKLLRLHVQAVLGCSVEEHSAFILQCVQQLFSA